MEDKQKEDERVTMQGMAAAGLWMEDEAVSWQWLVEGERLAGEPAEQVGLWQHALAAHHSRPQVASTMPFVADGRRRGTESRSIRRTE